MGNYCQSSEIIGKINSMLHNNFNYIDQGREDKPQFTLGESPFSGDCDDLAFAAYVQLRLAGLKPTIWIVKPALETQLHMLTCAKGVCIDSMGTREKSRALLEKDYFNWRRARQSEEWIEARLRRNSLANDHQSRAVRAGTSPASLNHMELTDDILRTANP